MNQQYFVPVSDDIIYNHPEKIEGPLVPYVTGMECHEWLSIEINPDESNDVSTANKTRNKPQNKSSANIRLVYSEC